MRANPHSTPFFMLFCLACVLLPGASCCPPPPAECTNTTTPTLVVQISRSFSELPLSVTGWACGGPGIDDQQLTEEYEVIVYVRTDKWYIQPFASGFRHRLQPGGCFNASAHDGDPVHVFLARRGWTGWLTVTPMLPQVDGTDIIAEWDSVPPPPTQCSDSADNDGDGLVDGDDPGCVDDNDDDESDGPWPECSDGLDNDMDGAVDANDCACTDASGQSELYDTRQDLAFLSSLGNGSTKWVDYSPTQYDPGGGQYPSELQIGLDLYVLKETGFDGILTYGAADTLASIPRLAREHGFGVVGMGIWDPLDEAEVDRAIAERQHVTFYIAGSEGLFVTPPRYTKDQLRAAISRVRRETCRPVTTAEPWDVMLANIDLFNDLDFIAVVSAHENHS